MAALSTSSKPSSWSLVASRRSQRVSKPMSYASPRVPSMIAACLPSDRDEDGYYYGSSYYHPGHWDHKEESNQGSNSGDPFNSSGQSNTGPKQPKPREGLWTLTNSPGINLMLVDSHTSVQRVFVILFGATDHGKEGIYSLRKCSEEGGGEVSETIVTFEDQDDASRYACLLEATMDHSPEVASMQVSDLSKFCSDNGYLCCMEPMGSLLIPPSFNVQDTDWELADREGSASVMASPSNAAYPSALARHAGLSGAELEQVKCTLERLLPSDDPW